MGLLSCVLGGGVGDGVGAGVEAGDLAGDGLGFPNCPPLSVPSFPLLLPGSEEGVEWDGGDAIGGALPGLDTTTGISSVDEPGAINTTIKTNNRNRTPVDWIF